MMTKPEAKRLGDLAIQLVTDQAVPGVRDLFQALVEERSRRFVAHLSAACDADREKAKREIRKLASSSSGEKLLMNIARECFFGTEHISLAAMAVLVSEFDSAEPSIKAVAGRAIESLADIDALTFLTLLSRPKACRPIPSRWRPGYAVDCSVARGSDWDAAKRLVGIDEETMFTSITECIRRRILLPDPGSGRLGSEEDIALRYFFISTATVDYYRILYRGLEIVEPSLVEGLALIDPEVARQSWPAADAATSVGRAG